MCDALKKKKKIVPQKIINIMNSEFVSEMNVYAWEASLSWLERI